MCVCVRVCTMEAYINLFCAVRCNPAASDLLPEEIRSRQPCNTSCWLSEHTHTHTHPHMFSLSCTNTHTWFCNRTHKQYTSLHRSLAMQFSSSFTSRLHFTLIVWTFSSHGLDPGEQTSNITTRPSQTHFPRANWKNKQHEQLEPNSQICLKDFLFCSTTS